jgi:hypothetical protein
MFLSSANASKTYRPSRLDLLEEENRAEKSHDPQ